MIRIRWRSLLTGHESHGDWLACDLFDLDDCVAQANRKWHGIITHWSERR